ncbi:MAG TPA: hypothetical protein VFH47_07920 [Candidatus Thermoplasmatota archaeon]|nr:hypothetical protein [Candidatus Thermoplasmatota archaeon]
MPPGGASKAPSGWAYLGAAVGLALVLAGVGVLTVQRFLGRDADVLTSLGTAAVVGFVIAAALLGRKPRRPVERPRLETV